MAFRMAIHEDSRRNRYWLDPRGYGAVAAVFNAYQDAAAEIDAAGVPAPFKPTLKDHYARQIIAKGKPHDPAELKAALEAVPAGSRCFSLAKGDSAMARIGEVLPGFAKLPPVARKAVCDYVASINPGFRAGGSYRCAAGEIREQSDHVAVPTGDGSTAQVAMYRARPGTVLLVPPPETLKRQAAHVDLTRAWIVDLSMLEGLELASLRIGYTEVADLTPLKGRKLSRLSVAGLKVADLAALKGLPLRELDASGTPLADLTPLAGMPLERLNLAGTKVADLTPLKAAPLVELDISGTPAADLSVLRALPLRRLNLAGVKLKDLRVLAGMKLTHLNADGTGAADLTPLAGLPLQEVVIPWRDATAGVEDLGKVRTLRTINGRPADDFLEWYRRWRKQQAQRR